jgi:signal transduction histidine kinase
VSFVKFVRLHSAPMARASRAARTPLTRLRQRLELARRRSGSIAEYRAAIDAAIGDSEAMLDLFAALLRIAQIESGTRRAGFAPIDLSAVLADLAEAYGPELEAEGSDRKRSTPLPKRHPCALGRDGGPRRRARERVR